MMPVQKIISLTKAVRDMQKRYFKTRDKEDLLCSKKLEGELDRALIDFQNHQEDDLLNQALEKAKYSIATQQIELLKSLKKFAAQQDKKIVYISGKVSGLDPVEVAEKFNDADNKLKALGYYTINPVKFIDPLEDWFYAMAVCIAILPFADKILLLPDWLHSQGASIENALAKRLGIDEVYI